MSNFKVLRKSDGEEVLALPVMLSVLPVLEIACESVLSSRFERSWALPPEIEITCVPVL